MQITYCRAFYVVAFYLIPQDYRFDCFSGMYVLTRFTDIRDVVRGNEFIERKSSGLVLFNQIRNKL